MGTAQPTASRREDIRGTDLTASTDNSFSRTHHFVLRDDLATQGQRTLWGGMAGWAASAMVMQSVISPAVLAG